MAKIRGTRRMSAQAHASSRRLQGVAQSELSTEGKPSADITKVASIREFEDAIEDGAPHIEIIEHLDFTTSRVQSVLDQLTNTHSIRVRK
jgi:hypothetical protein